MSPSWECHVEPKRYCCSRKVLAHVCVSIFPAAQLFNLEICQGFLWEENIPDREATLFFFLRLKKRVASFREKNVNICDTVVGTNLAHLCSKCLFFPHPRFGFPGHPQRTMVSQAWEENPMGFYTLENTHTLDKSHTFPTVIDDLCRYDHPVLLYIQTLFC